MDRFLTIFMLLTTCVLHAQDTLRGRVWQSDTNAPVPMVNIALKGTQIGTMTDFDGNFRLVVPSLQRRDTLLFSCLGFRPVGEPADLFTEYPFTLRMTPDAILLNEVVITPRTAEEYLKMALERRPHNYVTSPYHAWYYYRETVKENGKLTQHDEAVIEAFLPRRYTADTTRLYLYGARRAKDLGRVQFMQNYVDKKQSKAIKKAKKAKKIPLDSAVAKEGMRINFTTPYWLIDSNFAWNNLGFLNPAKFKLYEYAITHVTDWLGYKVLVIRFDQREKVKEPLYKGTIYLEENSLAVVAVDFGLSERGLKHLVPGYVKPLLWTMGISFAPPKLTFHMRFKQIGARWDFDYVYTSGFLHIEKDRWFKDDEVSDFTGEQLLYTLRRSDDVPAKPTSTLFIRRKQYLHKQFKGDYGITDWSHFNIPRHQQWGQ
jgi:hypothetical protein